MQIKAEVDHCRPRLLKYCHGQGLDLGCGSVKIKSDAIGIDIIHPDADMIKDARVLTDYPDNFFDYIFSSHLLEEIENIQATLKEWLRVIKTDGYIVLYQVDKEYYYPIGHEMCNSRHKHHFTWESLWEEFKKTGVDVSLIHKQRYSPEPYREWSFELVVKKGKDIDILETDHENISILVPTLNRPKDMAIFASSVDAMTTEKKMVEIVFGIHSDDLASIQAIKGLSNLGISVRGEIIDRYKDGKAHLSFLWNQLYKSTSSPIVGFFGDDVIFHTPGWDIEVQKEFSKNKNIMVSCNDVHIHKGKTATLFFTHRSLHDKVGYYLNESFRRWYVDTFWDEVFKMSGTMRYREDIITEHLSPDVFKDRADSTYKNMENLKGGDHVNWNSIQMKQEISRVASIVKGLGA